MGIWIVRIGEFDQLALLAVVSRRSPWLDAVMRTLTHFGSAPATIAGAFLLAFLTGPRLSEAGAIAAFAFAASHAAVQLLSEPTRGPGPACPLASAR